MKVYEYGDELQLGLTSECHNCGEPIHTTNFALGIGWTHTNRSSTDARCRIYARPSPWAVADG